MKKIALVLGILISITVCTYLLLRKEKLDVSEVDYAKILKTQCIGGQFRIFQISGEPSPFKFHFALLAYDKGEKIIPLALKEDKEKSPFYTPRDIKIRCMKDIKYLRILSLKKNMKVSQLKVIDSKVSNIDFSKMELSCGNKKVALTDTTLTEETINIGGIKKKLFSEDDGALAHFAKREFEVKLDDVPYLLVTKLHISCEINSNYTFFNKRRFFSLFNLKESRLVVIKKI
ncbi:MAG: hypothetical protein NXH75_09015 [Halobacteriovoraceae bacterium]|nr:hypothetical protein [Halobacteriovoraceae bacterium]